MMTGVQYPHDLGNLQMKKGKPWKPLPLNASQPRAQRIAQDVVVDTLHMVSAHEKKDCRLVKVLNDINICSWSTNPKHLC